MESWLVKQKCRVAGLL